MIVRSTGLSQLLITQPDHAALAAHIMRSWRADGFPDTPRQPSILLAIEEHDNGWREVDAGPMADPATGRILDFVNAPDEVRRGVWPRAVEGLAATPHAAALVAQHALHVYRRYRADSAWASFFIEMETTRNRHLEAASLGLEDLVREYFYVRIADLASLTFCNSWTETQTDDSGYAVSVNGTRLIVAPDPFGGREVALAITARELPNRPFDSPSEAHQAFADARVVVITGVAAGG